MSTLRKSVKMIASRFLIPVFAVALASPAAMAEDTVHAGEPHTESLGETLVNDLSSPYTTPAKPYFLSGLGVTLALLLLEDQISDPLAVEIHEDQPLGKFSSYGAKFAFAPNALYVAGFLAHGWLAKSDLSRSRAIVMMKSSLYSGGITWIVKHIAREPRPDFPDDKTAFPSAHATSAFAFASVIGAEYPWPYGVAAYTFASFVGLSRMNDDRHLLHQVVAGATIGLSYGIGIYHRERANREALTGEPSTTASNETMFQLLPTDRLDGAALYLSSNF